MAIQSLQKRKPKPRDQRTCAYCQRSFMAQRDKRRPNAYCSIRCGRHADRKLAPCPRCGVEFWPWKDGNHARKFCSPKCAALVTASRRAQGKQPKLPKVRVAPPARPCHWCGVVFQPAQKQQRFCSKPHNNIYKSKKRKAILRGLGGELPPLRVIYARDHGRCYICRRKVGLAFKWPDPRTASTDHVIPISKGGRDEATNARLAHLGCNIRKQSRIDTLF